MEPIGSSNPRSIPPVDSGSGITDANGMFMLLALEQMTVMSDAMVTYLDKSDNLTQTIDRLRQKAREAQEIRQSVIRQETQNAQIAESEYRTLQSSSDGGAPTKAQLEEHERIENWAESRGIELEDITKPNPEYKPPAEVREETATQQDGDADEGTLVDETPATATTAGENPADDVAVDETGADAVAVPVTKSESTDATDSPSTTDNEDDPAVENVDATSSDTDSVEAETDTEAGNKVVEPETPPQPKIIIDEAAMERNLAKISAYEAQVQSGTADNPAIRSMIRESAGFDSLDLEGNVTLEGLNAAATRFDNEAVQLQQQLELEVERLKVAGKEFQGTQESLDTMVDNRQAQENRDLRKEIDNKQDESEQQKLRRLVEESREWLDEMKDELHEKITIDVVQAAQREEMAREMERWQAEFEARMAAAVSGQPEDASGVNARLRRRYL